MQNQRKADTTRHRNGYKKLLSSVTDSDLLIIQQNKLLLMKIRKITLAVLIVFGLSILSNYKVIVLVITSLVSAVVSLSVSENPQGVITSFTYPSSVTVNNPMDFSVSFKNVGNVNITGKIIIFIKSSDLQTSAILPDDTFTLGIGETRIFNTTYTPTSGGNFFAFVIVTYDNKTAETNASFTVNVPSAPSPALSIVRSEEKKILTLEYPKYIKLNRGQSSLVQIFIRNDGNVDLNNLILSTTDSGLALNITPTTLRVLSPNSSFIFLISVKVPREASAGMYLIDFILASDKITKKGEIKVEVEVQKIEVEVEQTIKNYEFSIEKLFLEADKAAKEGRNTLLVIESLNQAKAELAIAKQLYESQDYIRAKEQLENVRIMIEQATVQLAQTVGPRIIFVPIPFPRPEITVSVAGTIALSAYYYYRKKKEDESYRKSIRTAIQIIKNKGEKKKWEASS
ncbi:MAG: hypothetical protein QXD72_00040 [Candidatus Aenigmatarchaeota archaeon]